MSCSKLDQDRRYDVTPPSSFSLRPAHGVRAAVGAMKGVAGFLILAVSTAAVCGALGFLYGSFCAIVAATPEKIIQVRSTDCRLWARAGPIMAVAVVVGALYRDHAWYAVIVFGAVAWLAAAAMRGGIYWSTTRRLARAGE